MNIAFSDEHEAFREEVKAFLATSLPEDLRAAERDRPSFFLDYEYNNRWHRILYEKGWAAPDWPEEYGGTGWDLARRYLWSVETSLAHAPSLFPTGIGMVGPMLIGHGTAEQKSAYLPRILSGEDYWCQGYSEPGSGSDLASLKLKAETDGDDYVLRGTKIWTSHAHYANRMFCLVRTRDTGKPQEGITFLLLDMDTPGITVQPILFASGTHEVNQVFFDAVRVPKANTVGKEHQGWTVAKYLLEFERGGGGSGGYEAGLERIRRLAANQDASGRTLLDDPAFKRRLDETAVRVKAIQYTELRIMAALSKGENPGPESSVLKTGGAEISQRLTELAVEALAYYIAPDRQDAIAPGQNLQPVGPADGVNAFPRYFNQRAGSIAGGSNEVQKNIVAKLVLGL
ncbi:MAG: acyl-CoA dehydrogenase family protein [Gammaproteobacteria bacterium]|nr:acyl-CoA dehydrogenase family protein [Gammaproteobacteria bacterium]MDE0367489.1 acyl-CoA dehydrogenase family protein [Gammaproteobacteria bacterium]